MALDGPAQAVLAAMAAAVQPGAPATWELSAPQARAAVAARRATGIQGLPTMHDTESHIVVAADGGEIAVRIHIPTPDAVGVIVYFHGGGWVFSDIDSFDRLARLLAERTGHAVALVGYRKAPEHPFPVAVDDAWAALEFIEAQRERLAGAAAPLIVAGDSAGGNLAAVVALRARDRRAPRISRQVLVYPVTDFDTTRGSYAEEENQTLLPARMMQWFWDQYVPERRDREHPDASPLRATTLSGVAPALVITAAHDVLRDEGDAYVVRLEAEKVPVTHHCIEGQMHGFFSMVDVLPASDATLDLIAAYLRTKLNKEPSG
jgi:acetyl esterase